MDGKLGQLVHIQRWTAWTGNGSNQHTSPIYSSVIFHCASNGGRGVCQDRSEEKKHQYPARGGRVGGREKLVHHRKKSALQQRGREHVVHYVGCEAMAWPHPVELCTTGDYNYSEYCTFTNLQLQFFIALLWSIRLMLQERNSPYPTANFFYKALYLSYITRTPCYSKCPW